MIDFGFAVFDIDLKPAEDASPQDAVNLIALYGPYGTKNEAEEYRAFVESDTRQKYAGRYEDGRYEFKLEVMPLQTAPVNSEGWL
jgi:hypothetical protein